MPELDVEQGVADAAGEYVAIEWFAPGVRTPEAVLAGDDEPDEDEATAWWCAAHEPNRVAEWAPFDLVLESDAADWPDLVQVPELELLVYSARFRDAVERVRSEGDTHAWLPVRLQREDETREYAVLNVWGATGPSAPGVVDPQVTGGRTVVLPAAGDGDPVFADRVREAAEAVGVELRWASE